MRKTLLLLSILNLIYLYICLNYSHIHNYFLLSTFIPLFFNLLFLMLGAYTLSIESDKKSDKIISILLLIVNIVPIILMSSVFLFL